MYVVFSSRNIVQIEDGEAVAAVVIEAIVASVAVEVLVILVRLEAFVMSPAVVLALRIGFDGLKLRWSLR